jgi:hypothetical protein
LQPLAVPEGGGDSGQGHAGKDRQGEATFGQQNRGVIEAKVLGSRPGPRLEHLLAR